MFGDKKRFVLLVNRRWGGGAEDPLWRLTGDPESDQKPRCGHSVITPLENVLSLVDLSFALGPHCDGKPVLKGGFQSVIEKKVN